MSLNTYLLSKRVKIYLYIVRPKWLPIDLDVKVIDLSSRSVSKEKFWVINVLKNTKCFISIRRKLFDADLPKQETTKWSKTRSLFFTEFIGIQLLFKARTADKKTTDSIRLMEESCLPLGILRYIDLKLEKNSGRERVFRELARRAHVRMTNHR